jgi:uracil-DNA glycosylase family 4
MMGQGFVRGQGPQPADILLLGEAPGEHEAQQSKPFVGQAGFLLDRLLARAGIDRALLRVANVLHCRPPHNHLVGAPYEHRAIDHCSQYLREELNLTKPKVIVTLGNVPFRTLAKLTGITKFRGFPIPGPGGSWIVPTLHPSYLLPREGQHDTARLTGAVILDLKKAVDIAAHGFTPAPRKYLLDPSPRDFELWAVEYEVALSQGEVFGLSTDIETPGRMKAGDDPDAEQLEIGSSQILRISFAWRKDKVVSVPWEAQYLPTIRRLLLNPESRLIFWNGFGFDLRVLAINGIVPQGRCDDAMWAWHLLQSDLPRGLESVTSHMAYDLGTWKNLQELEPAFYNAQDSVAALMNMIGIEEGLKAKGMWGIYERHVAKLYPFLMKAGREHGVMIDVKAQETLREELERDRLLLLRQAQKMVPSHLKPEKIYQREPKDKTDVTPVPYAKGVKCCSICGKENVTKVHFTSKKSKCLGGMLTKKVITTTAFKWAPDFDAIPDEELDTAINAAGFNPVSSYQMIAYAKEYGHTIPIRIRFPRGRRAASATGQPATTAAACASPGGV